MKKVFALCALMVFGLVAVQAQSLEQKIDGKVKIEKVSEVDAEVKTAKSVDATEVYKKKVSASTGDVQEVADQKTATKTCAGKAKAGCDASCSKDCCAGKAKSKAGCTKSKAACAKSKKSCGSKSASSKSAAMPQ